MESYYLRLTAGRCSNRYARGSHAPYTRWSSRCIFECWLRSKCIRRVGPYYIGVSKTHTASTSCSIRGGTSKQVIPLVPPRYRTVLVASPQYERHDDRGRPMGPSGKPVSGLSRTGGWTHLVLDTTCLHLVVDDFGTALLRLCFVDVLHQHTFILEDITL